jgi:hypothetical protein
LSYGGGGQTYTTLFDPATKTATEMLVTATGHDMFCPGTANLADGRILVSGGEDSAKTSIYDPATGSWTTGPQLNTPRGYNADSPVWDGSIFTLGGSWSGGQGNKNGEIWTASGGWRSLPGVLVAPAITADAAGIYRADNHMWLISTSTGRLLQAGPSHQMNWIDTAGSGSIVSAGNRADDVDSMCGTAVMYDVGKILKAGGATSYENVDAHPSAYVIDVTHGVSVRKVAPLTYARTFHNSVVLPNGQVVVIGGQTHPVVFTDDTAVLVPELWDPTTETFTALPAMAVPRTYHSIALLLPDGTVLSGGGGLCGNCATNHPDVQILTPPYLLNQDGTLAQRPTIVSAPSVLSYGSSANVTTGQSVSAFALLRVSSTTHTVSNDQRRIPLAFQSTGTNAYALTIPSNPGIALPGAYMLFALDSTGVPSVAKFLRLDPSATPVLTPPGDRTLTVNVASSITLSAVAPGGPSSITFGAQGLPPGLAINTATGVVSGTPTTLGTYPGSVSARNSAGSVTFDLTWTVVASAPPSTACGTANENNNVTLSCPAGQIMTTIAFASYGTPNGSFTTSSCNASPSSMNVTQSTCLGKSSCTMAANNATFGDPCSGTGKRMYVQATCTSSICGSASEGGTVSLSCPSGRVITAISFASYGMPGGSCGAYTTSACNAGTSMSVVSNLCLGKSSCSVGANNSVFGDPCSGTGKSLKVQATCG